MIKLIRRTTDNKYLKSVETETWVDDIKEAFEMTYRECEAAKLALEGVFLPEQLKEIVNMRKNKPITQEEKQELLNMLKK
jgi:zona occludens toxin (predicted ATPase)